MSDEDVTIEAPVATNDPVIYLITSGSYSDYSVHVAYPDKAEADRVVEELNKDKNWDDYQVEELQVITARQEAKLSLRMEFRDMVNFYIRDLRGLVRQDDRYVETENVRHIFPWQNGSPHTLHAYMLGSDMGFVVEGTDIERVRKTYSEKRAEWIAKQEGIA